MDGRSVACFLEDDDDEMQRLRTTICVSPTEKMMRITMEHPYQGFTTVVGGSSGQTVLESAFSKSLEQDTEKKQSI